MQQFLDIAVEAARKAGAILLSELDRPRQISYKGDGQTDLVTEADKRSEAAIVNKLRAHFSKHRIVAEEGTADAASSTGEEKYRWYVDPLDGTTNFAHGYPCFAVSIGLAEVNPDGIEEMTCGVVLNPVSGELFTAMRGGGAYLNQKRIRVSGNEKLSASLLATGFPQQKRTESPNINYYWRFTLASHGVRRDGSAALDLCAVACGRFEGFWEFGLKAWDTAAGVLMVREAGGMVTAMDGKPYHFGARDILASNGRVHAEMQILARDIAERSAQAPAAPGAQS